MINVRQHLGRSKVRFIGIAVAALAVVVVAVGVTSVLAFTTPYAIGADGQKVTHPWVVKVGSKEAFVVASQQQGQDIINGIKASYKPKAAQIKPATITPQVTVVEKSLKRLGEPPVIVNTNDAVAKVVTANKSATPMLTVTATEKMTKTQSVAFKTVYKNTANLYKGQKKVVTKGRAGSKKVVSRVIEQNGEVVSQTVITADVIKAPKAKVVTRGTKQMTTRVASDKVASGAVALGRGSGQAVADYALKFVGNPYVYGGCSLTNGTDCSGFTMSVYAHFGISLPHSASAQSCCGKTVSYKNAKPGDIVCYPGHVAIYIGHGKIVHASCPRTGIIVSDIHYRQFTCIKRILE